MRLLVLDEAWDAIGGIDTVRRFLLPALAQRVERLWWACPSCLHERRLEHLDLRRVTVLDTLPARGESGGWLAAALRRWPAGIAPQMRARADAALAHRHLRRLCRSLGATHALEICVFRRPFPRLEIPTSGIVNDLDYPNRGASSVDGIFREWLVRAQWLVAISGQTRDELLSLDPHSRARIEVCPLPPAPAPAPPGDEAVARWRRGGPVLFFPAGATVRKGHDVLFAALARLAAAGRPFHLYLSGYGTEHLLSDAPSTVPGVEEARQKCRAFAEALRGRVSALGWQPWQTVEELYAACDMVVVPSRQEGQGLPLIEALARSRPAVATRLPPAVARAEHYQAVAQVRWVEPGDAADLAAALESALYGAHPFPPFDAALRARLAAWNWDAFAARVIAQFQANPG